MITEDQSEVVAYLSSAEAHGGLEVQRLETHASIVFLAGDLAYKLKRAVRYDYLDFSTATRRHEMCDAELALNRRTAPTLYLDVVAVTRESDGTLSLNGRGAPADWVLRMRRFDQEGLLDRLAARDALDPALMAKLADVVARFHASADRRPDYGGMDGLRRVVDGNAHDAAEHADILDPTACAALTTDARAAIAAHAARLDARRSGGMVRACHGDLHLRNIVLLDGVPTLFDGIEFNDDLACVDVGYDLAFLLMDLWHRGLEAHANLVLNAYLRATGDLDVLPLLPLFLSCRAAVRAKTSAAAATMSEDEADSAGLRERARRYLALAQRLLRPDPPVLVAVGGLSGSGKSTLARALAPSLGPAPGALVIRSDEIRKDLHGVAPLDRLGDDAYSADMSARVYEAMAHRLVAAGVFGHAAVADAVFVRAEDRAAIEAAAARAGCPFVGLWLEAPERVLIDRVEHRTRDASDADARVVSGQLSRDPGAITWHRIAAGGAPDAVLEQARAVIAASTG